MKPPFKASKSPYLAPFRGGRKHSSYATRPPKGAPKKRALKQDLAGLCDQIDDLQRRLYAEDRYAVLLVFQALDAAGKDGTIRAVFNRVDPNGISVSSFKAPTPEELEHDFLWRTAKCLPRRGSIGIFNRSYYEEVLVVRVHPEYLGGQRLPPYESLDELWQKRYRAIREHERHLAESGTVILKFWLKHSREEQRQRFLARLTEPEKHWKFDVGDVAERAHWDAYMQAFEDMIGATSRSWAPWYVIPADSKPFMRATVAKLVIEALESLDLRYPESDDARRAKLKEMQRLLESEPE